MKQLNRLNNAYDKYISALSDMATYINQYTDFEASVFYQPSDGFVVVDDGLNNSPLEQCLATIKESNSLTHEQYLKLTI